MEKISNLPCLDKIREWNKSNHDFFTPRGVTWLDDETYLITLDCGLNDLNKIKFYSNTNLDYFFLEKEESSFINDKEIAELNYAIFNNEKSDITSVLKEIYEKINKSDSEEDLMEETDDEFNTGVHDISLILVKSEWAKKDKKLREEKGDNVNYFNIPKNLIYSGDIIFNIVANEILKLWEKKGKIKIMVPNNNIYQIRARFTFDNKTNLGKQLEIVKQKCGYDYIEIQININKYLYPFYPISLDIIKPKINNSLVYSLMDIDFLNLRIGIQLIH